jgi:hypothetical protein
MTRDSIFKYRSYGKLQIINELTEIDIWVK